MWNLGRLQLFPVGCSLPHSQCGKYPVWSEAAFVWVVAAVVECFGLFPPLASTSAELVRLLKCTSGLFDPAPLHFYKKDCILPVEVEGYI
jgi:hypothetical protein